MFGPLVQNQLQSRRSYVSIDVSIAEENQRLDGIYTPSFDQDVILDGALNQLLAYDISEMIKLSIETEFTGDKMAAKHSVCMHRMYSSRNQ